MSKKFSVIIKNNIRKFNKKISTIPGCKSTSFRALIFSSQTIGTSYLKGVLESDDIKCCIQSLRDLGVKIVKIKPSPTISKIVEINIKTKSIDKDLF